MTATASPERTESTGKPRPSQRGDRAFAAIVRVAAFIRLVL